MAKRFVDTELWQKEWFQDLPLKEKLLVKYIFENCDCAGVWNGNFKLASFIIGENITLDDLLAINDKKHQFDLLENGQIFVTDFIKFQYGTLSEKCKPHKTIIEKLKKYGLFERVSKGYPKGIQTLEEKEKEQYKEQYKEKEIPNKKDIETYCKLIAKKIDVNEFINWYSASNWKDKEGMPINWQQKVLSWAKREPLKEVDGWSL